MKLNLTSKERILYNVESASSRDAAFRFLSHIRDRSPTRTPGGCIAGSLTLDLHRYVTLLTYLPTLTDLFYPILRIGRELLVYGVWLASFRDYSFYHRLMRFYSLYIYGAAIATRMGNNNSLLRQMREKL